MPSPVLLRLEALRSARTAVTDDTVSRSFDDLWLGALRAASVFGPLGRADGIGERVALLASPGPAWVEAFFGILLAGGVAVPLSPLYPPSELAWFARDADAHTVVVSDAFADHGTAMADGRRRLSLQDLTEGSESFEPWRSEAEDVALLLYTSGTTGKPKGAMLTHANVATQAALLCEAWRVAPADSLLHALPLHHLHGLGISLLTCILGGAATRMLPRFDTRRVWEAFAEGGPTVWMAVPTMYQKLIEAFDGASSEDRVRFAAGARRLRLATSGSAALPVTLAERWRAIAGSVPLERFGMTEIGVGTSNPVEPAARRAGTVGLPLPSVESRIEADSDSGSGELWIRGPSVFRGYFRREEATREAFRDGWFRTGDVAEQSADGYVRLLGRTSVDILKSGGYKLSALEIEETLRENDAVAEVAVVGLPDATWGDRVVAVIVPAIGRADDCATEPLRAWAKSRLPSYKVPREVVVVDALPRNPLGKVLKPELAKRLAGQGG